MKNNKDVWKPKGRIESLYLTLIQNLLKPIRKAVMKAAESGDVQKVARLLKKASKNRLFKKKSEDIAKKIVTMEWNDQAKTWREAARMASKNPFFYEQLEVSLSGEVREKYDKIIEDNAKYIRTLPEDIATGVVKHISRKQFQGERSSEIAKEIKEFFPRHTKAKENLIARTETAKCKAAITKVRSEHVGIYWAKWVSSDDQRVRPSHHYMDGILFDMRHPPSPEGLAKKAGVYKGKVYGHYGPGNIFNCRCFARPLVLLTNVKFPAKVYNWKTDKIETMTKAQFIEFTKLHKSYNDMWERFS